VGGKVMKKDEKLQFIWDYIFGSGGKTEWKERFEIAWDVWETFEEIRKEIRKRVIESLYKQLKENSEFKDYEITDLGLREGKKWQSLILYKQNWLLNPTDTKPVLGYAIEADRHNYYHLYYGIIKYDNDKGVPFKGKWEEANIPEEWKKVFALMKESLYEPWRTGDWWIVWRYFDKYYSGMWQKEFYEEIINRSNNSIDDGCKEVAKYYVERLVDLKNRTEHLIDEFVRLYK
jgi:hypothetical protein